MKTTILLCKCGKEPILCYHDYLSCHNGSYGASVHETIRFYRYICPHCYEWGRPSEFPSVAKRFWNQQEKQPTTNRYQKCDFLLTWKSVETDEIICKQKTKYNGNCWGVF